MHIIIYQVLDNSNNSNNIIIIIIFTLQMVLQCIIHLHPIRLTQIIHILLLLQEVHLVPITLGRSNPDFTQFIIEFGLVIKECKRIKGGNWIKLQGIH